MECGFEVDLLACQLLISCQVREPLYLYVSLLRDILARCCEDAFALNRKGETLLHIAAGAVPPNVDAARVLLEFGFHAVIGAKSARGFSALHIAVMQNCIPLAKLLIAAGADPTAPSDSGQTALEACDSFKLPPEMKQALIDRPLSEPVFCAPGDEEGVADQLVAGRGYGDMRKLLVARKGYFAFYNAFSMSLVVVASLADQDGSRTVKEGPSCVKNCVCVFIICSFSLKGNSLRAWSGSSHTHRPRVFQALHGVC